VNGSPRRSRKRKKGETNAGKRGLWMALMIRKKGDMKIILRN